MGRGRQSRQKIADKVRHEELHKRFLTEYGEPENPHSPSSVFMHVGHNVSFALTEGMQYGIHRAAAKAIRQQRLDARPLWKIAISDRRVHAAEYDDRRRRDIRNRMRDRAELKTSSYYGGVFVFDEPVDWGGAHLDDFTEESEGQ